MKQKSLVEKFAFWARNARSAAVFKAIETYGKGVILDVGGRDFFSIVKARPVAIDRWISLDVTSEHMYMDEDKRFRAILGDGCALPFRTGQFDTILNIQVLEHVFDPLQMVKEIGRVLKKGGHGIFLIPQTAVLHELPHHYYNFTKFWIEAAMPKAGLKIVMLKPLGGVWSSMASHLVYFFFQAFRAPGYTYKECRRSFFFYLLCPLMFIYAVISIPFCMFLSLGDLNEEPNNYLVVVQK